jgi:hypothetical protein
VHRSAKRAPKGERLSRRQKFGARGALTASVALTCLAFALLTAAAAYAATIEHLSLGEGGTGNGAMPITFNAISADGSRVFFTTNEKLTPDDTDGNPDVYERAGGVTTHISTIAGGANGVNDGTFRAISDDGSHAFFQTGEKLVPEDNDGKCYSEAEQYGACSDIYERFNGTTTMVSTGPTMSNVPTHARLRGVSKDGLHVFFATAEPLVAADTDTAVDIYDRFGGNTSLVSTGPTSANAELDAVFKSSSDDGSRVFLVTQEPLTSADTDSESDVYERSGGTTTLLSTGPSGGNGALASSFQGASADGTRVLVETEERLTSADTDSSNDVYQRSAGTTTLLSTGPTGGNGAKDAFFESASNDATRVFFETSESLVAGDTDARQDVYERTGGTTSLSSTGPTGGSGNFDAAYQGASRDGTRLWIGTFEQLAPTDTDAAYDIYERAGGTTTQVSLGPGGGNGSADAFFDRASNDGTRVFFESAESLVGTDTDTYVDVYQRYGGVTTLLTPGPSGTSTSWANLVDINDNGTRVFFETGDALSSTDTDTQNDLYASIDTGIYARPKGASPFLVPLVIAYRDCTSANSVHGTPLSSPSCKPPLPVSDWLTVGTPDSNGQGVKSVGEVLAKTIVGDSSTAADEADAKLTLDVSDVRNKSGLGDYAGELQVRLDLRVTDKLNGVAPVDPGTLADFTLSFTGVCAPTADTTVGSSCSADTTADAIVPGVVAESMRTVWQIGTVQVYDGGSDGDVDTAPNTLFERQGIFVP